MKRKYATGIRSSDLRLVDVPASGDAAPASADSGHASPTAGEDRFLAKATEEHAAGRIDPRLWARAVAQAGGDKALAKGIYLDSRATALRVAKRRKDATKRALVVETLSNTPETDLGGQGSEAPEARDETTSKEPAPTRRGRPSLNRRRVIIMAAGAVIVVAIVAGSIVLWSETGPAQQNNVATPAPPIDASERSKASGRAALAAMNTDGAARARVSGEDFVVRVQSLEKDGNWNLLVIHAMEWTRKQPGNADAWKKLSLGYVKLRQFGEALDAATKAVQLAPEDFLAWQNLAQLYVALQRPAEALLAFEKAAALNDRDVVSLAQEGILNTQLGRLPDARIAFNKALAVSPEDVPALCGSAVLAQQEGRAKDAEVIARQVTSLGAHCLDPGAGENVRVTASGPAKRK